MIYLKNSDTDIFTPFLEGLEEIWSFLYKLFWNAFGEISSFLFYPNYFVPFQNMIITGRTCFIFMSQISEYLEEMFTIPNLYNRNIAMKAKERYVIHQWMNKVQRYYAPNTKVSSHTLYYSYLRTCRVANYKE